MADVSVGVLGAGSLVTDSLLPLLRDTYSVLKWSRGLPAVGGLQQSEPESIPYWISLAPIWGLPSYFETFLSRGARRVVALSSTTVFSKTGSPDGAERAVAHRLIEAEKCFSTWAENQRIEWLILRPTLIYGEGRDRNVSEVARFIRLFGFFPVLAPASGLRQPIHVGDVALACKLALEAKNIADCAYNISGGETLSYRDMLVRIFEALDKTPQIIEIPLWLFQAAITCIRVLPRFRGWSAAMALRMSTDLVFDHGAAACDFGFSPRQFKLAAVDLAKR